MGRTRRWVAAQLGIEPASLRTLLCGQRPGVQTLKLLARILECDEATLEKTKSSQAS